MTAISIFALIPLGGSLCCLVIILLRQFRDWRDLKKSEFSASKKPLLKLLLAFAGLLWGGFVGFFLIWLGFFRGDHPIPLHIWISGLALTVPYLGAVAILFAVPSAVEYGLSTSKMELGTSLRKENRKLEEEHLTG